MAPRSQAAQRARALERRQAYLECRDLLARLARAVGERRPQNELDAVRAEASEWLKANPRNR